MNLFPTNARALVNSNRTKFDFQANKIQFRVSYLGFPSSIRLFARNLIPGGLPRRSSNICTNRGNCPKNLSAPPLTEAPSGRNICSPGQVRTCERAALGNVPPQITPSPAGAGEGWGEGAADAAVIMQLRNIAVAAFLKAPDN